MSLKPPGAPSSPYAASPAYLRGCISSDGSTLAGTGFTSSKLSTGKYRVTFNVTQSQPPIPTVSVNGTSGIATTTNISTTSFDVWTYTDAGVLADKVTTFIAVPL